MSSEVEHKRVLAADESGCIRRLIRVNLEADGLRVCEAETEKDCLEAVESQGCDLILLSLDMPGLDPVQIVSRIRKREAKQLPVLLISADEPSPCLLRFLEPAAYIRKPFDAARLADMVKELLAWQGTREEREMEASKREKTDEIAAAINSSLLDGELPCAAAFKIAEALGVAPLEVGRTANAIRVKLSRCQLGLFGYGSKAQGTHRILKPMPKVPEELAQAIRDALEDGGLRCAAAWEIAARLQIPKMDVSSAAEAMGIKITYCQLGAFPR